MKSQLRFYKGYKAKPDNSRHNALCFLTATNGPGCSKILMLDLNDIVEILSIISIDSFAILSRPN